MSFDEGGQSGNGSGSLVEGMLDFLSPQPLAPPSRTPPGPPAALTPGTPQNDLVNAQDSVRSNEAYQPEFNSDGSLKQSYCNMATLDTVKAMNGPLDGLKYSPNGNYKVANDAATALAMSKDWTKVSPSEARDIANQGTVVVGVQRNPGGHGHMVTVRPEIMPGVAEMSGEAPIVNNVGAKVNIVPADQAFDSSKPVRYYAPAQR